MFLLSLSGSNPDLKENGLPDPRVVCCFPPALGLGRERVCNHEGSDSKLGMMAVSHLAPDRDGTLQKSTLAGSTAACSGVRPARITVALKGEREPKESSF